jgi:iron-sulfur cluster assembly protein
MMLALTDTAAEIVKDIVASSGEAPDTAGVRLWAAPDVSDQAYRISVASSPGEGDKVIEEEGARVFVEPQAAILLEDMMLDAIIEDGRAAFTIIERFD